MATSQSDLSRELEKCNAEIARLKEANEALKAKVPNETDTQADPNASREQRIDPFNVSAGTDSSGKALAFDYVALSKQWGTSLIDQALLERFERVTGHKPHRLMRRGLIFSHRDFNAILDAYEKGEPFFIYTGRGPSSDSMHIGHTIPFEFTKYLSDVFNVPLVLMLTDDEKFLFKESLTVEEVEAFSMGNAKDMIAMGFDEDRTFIYSDFKYMGGHFYRNSVEFARLIPQNQVRGAFGFDESTNIGRVNFAAAQCAAAFATSYPVLFGDDPNKPRDKATARIRCLIPMAIDQDPYFRLLRSNCHRMRNPSPKAALIHSQFLTALQGAGGKMSASDATSAIFTSDTPKKIKDKINKYAFSGGRDTIEEHRKYGGNPDVDVSFQYLTYFLEDDAELERIREGYKKGEILTGELKKMCIELLQEHIGTFQKRRVEITDEDVHRFMTPRVMVSEEQILAKALALREAEQNGSAAKSGEKSKRPGIGSRNPTYGVQGLSSYGQRMTDMIYGDGANSTENSD